MENKNINKTPPNNKDRSPPNGGSFQRQESPCVSPLLPAFVPPLEKYKIGVEIVCLFVVQGGSLNKGKSKGIKHLKTPFYLRDERETDKTRVIPSVTKQT